MSTVFSSCLKFKFVIINCFIMFNKVKCINYRIHEFNKVCFHQKISSIWKYSTISNSIILYSINESNTSFKKKKKTLAGTLLMYLMLKIQLPYSRTKLKLSIKTFNRHLLSSYKKIENNLYKHLRIKTKIYYL